MDTEQLKNRIREALGAAGMPRGVSEQVEQIIDSMAARKEEKPAPSPRPAAQPARVHLEDEEDDEDDVAHRAALARVAETRTKPARKTRSPRKKK